MSEHDDLQAADPCLGLVNALYCPPDHATMGMLRQICREAADEIARLALERDEARAAIRAARSTVEDDEAATINELALTFGCECDAKAVIDAAIKAVGRLAAAEQEIERLKERQVRFDAAMRLLWRDVVFVGSRLDDYPTAENSLRPVLCVNVSSYGADAEPLSEDEWVSLCELYDKYGDGAEEGWACFKRGTSKPDKGDLNYAGKAALADLRARAAFIPTPPRENTP